LSAYDAENRQISYALGGVTTTYTYDGDGRRVKKVSGSTTTVYVYDAQGQLAAEYAPVQPAACVTCYLTADTLGSTRMLTDEAGTPRECHDYLPFGEEIPRTGAGGCYTSNTSNTLKFTGKERDAETGLDYFGARYFSGAQGRFTSPDDPLINQRAYSPQSWNLFTYARNSPLRFVDPSGNCSVKPGASQATDDPGEPCVDPSSTHVTVTSGPQSDPQQDARARQLVIMTDQALTTQLSEVKDIAITTYISSTVGWVLGKFVVAPAVNAIATRLAARRALQAAAAAAKGARAGRTWVAAYDTETGAIAVGHSGPVPNAADVHPDLLGALDNAGGLGAKNAGAVGRVGCCAEVDAANQLIQKGSKLENIRFTDAIRPNNPGTVIPTCPNCQATFGAGK
jgi:RHS repeat-associated protein